MPHDYDFFAFLRGLSAAQKRADEKALKTQEGYTLDGSPRGRSYNVTVWDDIGDPGGPSIPVAHAEGAGDHLQALRDLLKFLGED